MARYQFPLDRTALIVQAAYEPVLTPPHSALQLYTDASASVLADVRTLSNQAIPNSTIYVDGGVIPEFLGPDGEVRVWGKILGSTGAAYPLFAQVIAPPGGGGVDSFVHTQTVPQSTVTIAHGFGRYPAAVAFFSLDLTSQWEDYSVRHTNVNTTQVSMDTPTPGVFVLI